MTSQRISPAQKRAIAREAAMPEVKRLVKRFGRTTISACLNIIKNYERSSQRLQALKNEVARLEKKF